MTRHSILAIIQDDIDQVRTHGGNPSGIVLDESDLCRARLELEGIFRTPQIERTFRPATICGLPVYLSEKKTPIIILVPLTTIGTEGSR